MLHIVTGTPGAGKTLFTLSRLKADYESKVPEQQRKIFVHGIPDLNYEYFHADELTEPDTWYELPEGSIIVFDEAQTVFPQRPASQKVPRKCQEFSTHRHRGYDIYIITQDASNIDAFVRRMCGCHYHVHRILGRNMATVYQYDHYESRPTGYHEKQAAIEKLAWKYPKKIFDKYKSATMHTVQKKTPLRLYFLGVIVLVTAAALYKAWDNFSQGKFTGDTDSEKGLSRYLDVGAGNGAEAEKFRSKTPLDYLDRYKPRVEGIWASAPIYDGVDKVVSVPKPHCVIIQPFESGESDNRELSRCVCYTQQITRYETSDAYCRSWATEGYFDSSRDGFQGGGMGGRGAQAPAPSTGKVY